MRPDERPGGHRLPEAEAPDRAETEQNRDVQEAKERLRLAADQIFVAAHRLAGIADRAIVADLILTADRLQKISERRLDPVNPPPEVWR